MPARRTPVNPVEDFTQQLVFKTQAAALANRADALKTRLKDWLKTAKSTYKNENGSIFYDLPETITVHGKNYKGMELRRSTGTVFNEDVAEEILTSKGPKVLRKAQSLYMDQDKISRLHQEGVISDEELDKMFEEKPETWSFYATEGEVL